MTKVHRIQRVHLRDGRRVAGIVPQYFFPRTTCQHRDIIADELVVLLHGDAERLSGIIIETADLAVLDDVHDVVQRQVLVDDDVERHK